MRPLAVQRCRRQTDQACTRSARSQHVRAALRARPSVCTPAHVQAELGQVFESLCSVAGITAHGQLTVEQGRHGMGLRMADGSTGNTSVPRGAELLRIPAGICLSPSLPGAWGAPECAPWCSCLVMDHACHMISNLTVRACCLLRTSFAHSRRQASGRREPLM